MFWFNKVERQTRQGKISYVTAWVISATAKPLPTSWSLLFQRRYRASSMALEQSSEVSRNMILGPWTEVLLVYSWPGSLATVSEVGRVQPVQCDE